MCRIDQHAHAACSSFFVNISCFSCCVGEDSLLGGEVLRDLVAQVDIELRSVQPHVALKLFDTELPSLQPEKEEETLLYTY